VVAHAENVLLADTVCRTGLDGSHRRMLAPWRAGRFVHAPGKILLDLARAVALGGDAVSDIAVMHAESALFGPVAPAYRHPGRRRRRHAGGDSDDRAAARVRAWDLVGRVAREPGARELFTNALMLISWLEIP